MIQKKILYIYNIDRWIDRKQGHSSTPIKPTITNKKKIPEENSLNKPLTSLREVD